MQANRLFCLTVPVCENAKLDPSLPDAGSALEDEVWRFEIDNEKLFPGEGGEALLMLQPIRCNLPSRVIHAKNQPWSMTIEMNGKQRSLWRQSWRIKNRRAASFRFLIIT